MRNRMRRLSELSKVPKFARLDHRNLLNKAGKPIWQEQMTRNERRKQNAEAKKLVQQYKNILMKLHKSGVGFPVDQTTRSMAIEYTHRFASSGTETQPISFNYFEPFFDIKLINGSFAPYVDLVPEVNHLFSASDFFDYLTSIDSEDFNVAELINIPDSETLHFTNNGNIEDLTFFDASGREYILSGFTMVRRGNSIHWFVLAGEKLSSEEWDMRVKNASDIKVDFISPRKRAFLEESIELMGEPTAAPMKLEGAEFAVRTLVAGEFDFLTEKHLGKSIFIETENSFDVFSDDPELLDEIASADDRQEFIDKAMERIGQASILWNMAEGLFQLPRYFETRVTVARSLVQDRGSYLGLKGKGGKGIKAEYVAVEAVSVQDSEEPSAIRRISLPVYSIETEGHWRRLKFGQIGRDREGNPVARKTWVKRANPWRGERKWENVVFVKDCLAMAKVRVAELYAASEANDTGEPSDRNGNGNLYVLRCTLMAEEVYKVGWTSGTASERAKQLSAATGVPLAFTVVESWGHNNPRALETEVHAQLLPYRVNNQREFFRLNFDLIRKIIIQTIDRVAR